MSKVIIIGNSAAGLSALESFRKYDQKSEVLIISKEGRMPYSRVLISYILRKKIQYSGIEIRNEDYFKAYNAQSICAEVTHIDTVNKVISTKENKYEYDQLLIASGSYAVKPPIPGIDHDGIYNMWTRSDLDHLMPCFDQAKRVCVIGSGFVALQAAWAALSRGLEVTIIELMDRIMPSVLDIKGAEILSKKIREKGAVLMTGTSTKAFEKCSDGTFKVHIEGKEDILADFIIIGTGVRSNMQFLADSNIAVNRGILVDKHMQTNIEDVYAAGDVAAGPTIFNDEHLIHALWPTACEMGRIAGENMAGLKSEYEGSLNMNVTEMYGITIASMGKFNDADIDEAYIFDEADGYGYLKICLKDGLLIGACLAGSSDAVAIFGKLRPLIRKKEKINCELKDIYNYLNKETFKRVSLSEDIL